MEPKTIPVETATLFIVEASLRRELAEARELTGTQFALFMETAAMVISALHWSGVVDGVLLADAIEERMRTPELAQMPQMGDYAQLLAGRVRDEVMALPQGGEASP